MLCGQENVANMLILDAVVREGLRLLTLVFIQ